MRKENYNIPKSENETENQPEYIEAPKGCYFIHGVKEWNSNHSIGVRTPEISCSLQRDGFTKPIRPYGYILRLSKGAIRNAYDKDVTSQYYDSSFRKRLSEQTRQKNFRNYHEDELIALMENTQQNSHNELWVNAEKAEISEAYVKKSDESSGVRAFMKACRKENIPIHWIE